MATTFNRKHLFPWSWLATTVLLAGGVYVAAPFYFIQGLARHDMQTASLGALGFLLGVPAGVWLGYLVNKDFNDYYDPPWKYIAAKSLLNYALFAVFGASALYLFMGAPYVHAHKEVAAFIFTVGIAMRFLGGKLVARFHPDFD